VDLFANGAGNWNLAFREPELYFDLPALANDPMATFCHVSDAPTDAGAGSGTGGGCGIAPAVVSVEYSPASMQASSIDEELFGCSETSNDCSCSDLLTSSLDLTIYGQVSL